MIPAATPGWYGKLPALGDFASRRLEPQWIEAWDRWLAAGLQGLREGAPDDWLADYLASPAWRFALLPGALEGLSAPGSQDATAQTLCVGALVPSVDRVGRYFPLVVASPELPWPQSLAAASALWRWTSTLEDLAVSALQGDWTAEVLDDFLAAACAAQADVPGASSDVPPSFETGLASICTQATWQALQGRSLWFSAANAAEPLQVRGLPSGADFRALFTAAIAAG